jgi:hypothetical protein
MEENLYRLYEYLSNNGYKDDAKRVLEIKENLTKTEDKTSIKRLIAMCNPRYLGELEIKDFKDVYQWWNFLGMISEEAKKLL